MRNHIPMSQDPAHNWKAANGGKRDTSKHAGFQGDIFGYSWEQIQAGQQGNMRAMRGVIDLSKPAKKPATDADKALLAQHGEEGLRAMGYWGVLDRLNLPIT